MSALMTPGEVITNAFDRAIEATKITAADIEAVQQKHLIPVLGEDFYDAIIADTASYTALIAKLKPALAFMVKYYILPRLQSEVSTTGIALLQGRNNQKGGRSELGDHQQAALDAYDMLMGVVTKYLDDNSDTYPLYYRATNPHEQIVHAGGIIFRANSAKDDFYTDEDDYWINKKNKY